jgi:predicted naringenin-chalcone synthase
MSVYINHIASVVPDFSCDQDFLMNFMKKHVAKDRMSSMIIHRIYTQSGIQKRHSVVTMFGDIESPSPFLNSETKELRTPMTGERNAIYMKEARKLYIGASKKLFDERPDIPTDTVTHVITVSCTGFYAPGPDLDIVNALGLPTSTQRLHIGFMGCYAVLPALRTAKSIIEANPDAVVLLVSAELCSLHFKFDDDTNSLLSTTVFADGCAAALLSSKQDFSVTPRKKVRHSDVSDYYHDELIDTEPSPSVLSSTASSRETEHDTAPSSAGIAESSKTASDTLATGTTTSTNLKPVLRLDGLYTTVTPNGAEDMAWTIGDYGFDMVLSSYIPDLISSNLEGVLQPIWEQSGFRPEDIDLWAVHPGGRAILDKVQQHMKLADNQLESSRSVLMDYGNMSSATILFVLSHLMRTTNSEDAKQVLAMAFGPGITVETALLTYMP